MMTAMANSPNARSLHLRRATRLEYLTVGWNLIEGLVAIASSALSGSIALLGFGIDSFIETFSGAILLWRLRAEGRGRDAEFVERKALWLVGTSFMLLAGYVVFDSAGSLLHREAPQTSIAGISLAVLSLIVMPMLARAKRRTAGDLKSGALKADSRQTSLCAYLSLTLLVGLLLNATLGWWWADPVAALGMVPVIVAEGWEAFRGETCPHSR